MNNTIKALLGAALLTVVMSGCETMAERAGGNTCPDGKICDPTQCEDSTNCDPSNCEMKDCPKKAAACPTEKKADCDKSAKKDCDKSGKKDCDKSGKAAKAACPTEKKAMECGVNCTMPCCA